MMMKKWFLFLFSAMVFSAGFTSCDKDENTDGPDNGGDEETGLASGGAFILCRGNWNMNNASLGYYDPATGEYEANIFAKQNSDRIGESAEQMLIYGNKMYITVYGSNAIIVTDLNAKTLEIIKPEGTETMGPRGLAAYDGNVFVGYYMGHSVAVLDTTTLTVTKTIDVGRFPEQMVVANDKLYVTNSGGGDFPDVSNTISVVDLNSFTEERKIEVEINPTKITANSRGDLFVISMGDYDYDGIHNTLQKIDAQTYEVKVLGNASVMSMANDKLYTIYYQMFTDENYVPIEINLTYVLYDALTGKVEKENFLNNPTLESPYSLTVDPQSGDIYINEFDWATTNELYIFDKNGNQQKVLETQGYDVAGVWFRP